MWKQAIATGLLSIGLAVGLPQQRGMAQAHVEMPVSEDVQEARFRQIEQPLGVKGAVTLGGLALIGLELWWFLFSKSAPKQAATIQEGVQEVTIAVDGGYEPSHVTVKAGNPVRLNFLRRDPSSCLDKVLLPDFHIAQELTLDQVTPVEFKPEKPGEYEFTCGMNMYRGKIEVT